MPSSPTARQRFLFFGGKGGVGKTTCAAAAALSLPGPVLALSLDPAHSLRDVLGEAEVDVLELDARQAFREFMGQHREELRAIADRGTYFDDEDIEGFLDLSLPGLDEIMGLLELGRLARDERYQRIVVDLPPTGHALRLFDVATAFDQLVEALELMQDKHRFAVTSLTRRYARDDIDAFLQDLRRACQAAHDVLIAPGVSGFVLVSRPEPMVLAETARYAERLRSLGAEMVGLVLNDASRDADVGLPAELQVLPQVRVPWLPEAPIGSVGLEPVMGALGRLVGTARRRRRAKSAEATPLPSPLPGGEGISRLLEQPRRLMIFGGKGGVGKTTLAAAVALALARRSPERSVMVVSIDAAHSLGDSFGQALGDDARQVDGLANLLAIELDPERHWRQFKEDWQAEGEQLFQGLHGAGHLDPVYDRQIAAQLGKIQPTGLDELQAATSVIDLLDEDPARLVVVDSAPTGHLLRFLESPALVVDWAKELMRILLKYGLATRVKRLSEDLLELSRKTKRLEALLHDPKLCEVVVVTMAERPVIAETQRLTERLQEMRIAVRHVVVNQATGDRRQASAMQGLRRRFPELRFVKIARRAEPIQGLAALQELAA
ncbi:MAG TPA: ArsA family ATPase [Chloroflexota bacterium]|nr:ArsA family ATPase [Chloroflexota bacterium]